MKIYPLPEIKPEDDFNDVLGKALRGKRLTIADLASASKLSEDSVRRLLDGKFDRETLERIAPELDLNSKNLIALAEGDYLPKKPEPFAGLAHFNTPFGDMMANSYLVWDTQSKKAVAFDTGSDVSDMLEILKAENLILDSVFITHAHGDHIFDLERLQEKTKVPAFSGEGEAVPGAESFSAGKKFSIGSLEIETRLTNGHSEAGISYIVTGLTHRLAFVGDALFAASMGAGGFSYEQALKSNRKELFTLPDDTIVCPGHGPLTTIGEERLNNPFYSE